MDNEFQIRAYLIKGLGDVELKFVWVNDENYILVRRRLELERKNAIKILIDMRDNGQILWINKPRIKPKNNIIQEQINELMLAKGDINKSITKIKEMYYK